MTPSQHIHCCAGHPAPAKHAIRESRGPCAWCGAETGRGVPLKALAQIGIAAHVPLLNLADHACQACAWLVADPKRHHRALLAYGDRLLWPVLSPDNATDERPTWLDALAELSAAGAGPVVAVLTTDPKPRLWHRAPLATVQHFAAYLHSTDHDMSAAVSLPLRALLDLAAVVRLALDAGYSKRRCWDGLLTDHPRLEADPGRALEMEAALAPHRGSPLLCAAVLIAHRSPKL